MIKKNIIVLYIIVSIVLNCCLATFIFTPSTPGIISPYQISSIPLATVSGDETNTGSSNQLQPIGPGCQKLNNVIQSSYFPVMILNSTAYLARGYNDQPFELAIVTSNGITPLVVKTHLAKVGSLGISRISYDDRIGASGTFIFIDSSSSVNIYDINQDDPLSIQFVTPLNIYSQGYYEYSTQLYYVPTYSTNSDGSLLQSMFIVDATQTNSFKFYSISSLNLPHSMDTIYSAAYNGQLVLFGPNSNDGKSYLYLVNTKSNTYQFLGERDYNTTMITGVNSRYLLFTNSQGTQSELLDLDTQTSKSFNGNCINASSYNFLTSIIPSSIFK